jgi:hypothetical protein
MALKQHYTQTIQAREVMKQAKESHRQGRAILLGTIMIIIFVSLRHSTLSGHQLNIIHIAPFDILCRYLQYEC